ncbi:hypothetical protein L3556_14535 [Candidatus Synechococcus calcipolaris G9]|uniref:Radical SAM protein n=1 Tax=Candidatus Synechococcus calcipolaris G9 TaxID=1497997 RepID=A0ABT6F2Y2_9SYNE|nr:radical SAM/SPASM domain-containing protein [Candidatus Synechococcus calcipolaris]MDG2992137.1 hypothetical protein [Candidatus Synechococcus calcipolaris G9]
MTRIYATATLKHLLQRRRLNPIIERWNLEQQKTEQCFQLLRQLVNIPQGIVVDAEESPLVNHLIENYLVQADAVSPKDLGLPFVFVEAINFELTYGCNLACAHCLQDALRPQGFHWISQEAVIRALKDGQWLGLTTLGVNFTGGEIFMPGSPVLGLLAVARDLGIPARANTNAWWGGRTQITIGTHTFADDEAVVEALIQQQLGRLALSLDNRYQQYPSLLDRVVQVATLCEAAQLSYEFVATDPSPEVVYLAWDKLTQRIGCQPCYLMMTPMEKVDVGAPARDNQGTLKAKTLVELAVKSPCKTYGFYRPYFLHVAPHGGIRSCMQAPNGSWLGNIMQQRLPEILNRASQSPVYRLFKDEGLAAFCDRYLTPWQHLYRNVTHGCTASALLARLAEEIHRQEASLCRPLATKELEALHQRIGKEYHLLQPTT